ncbi:MAG TPA: hypothetical protein VFV19_18625 [Candidatus Polarisedimenticolaceae bacterium]|nr:hypothetical protein [Candidatus Polarisedimenticolaceae bacterium]
MRRTFASILALTAVLSAPAVRAQAEPVKPSSGTTPKDKQKTQLLALVDHTRALARWMPNESSFLTVLDRVQDRLAAAKESDLAPLAEFDPYVSNLTETLARMESRVSTLQTPVDICDPSRKRDLFLLFLDVLDVDGQGQVQAKICEKLSSEQGTEGSLSEACVATSLGLLAARSMQDLIVACDPSLTHASADAARFEKLSVELAGVQAGVQASVKSVKSEMTQAMTVVAGQMIDVSSLQTKQLGDLTVRLEIEKALQQGTPYGSLYLPAANGGRLETVRAIVDETIGNVVRSGESANQATEKLAAGDDQVKLGHFKQAFRLYSDAYKAAVALPSKPRP